MSYRTDRNMNPAAFTTDIAAQAGLKLGVDYEIGDKFPDPSTLHTAKLLGDPIQTTIRVIDAVGYVTKAGHARWTYINIPQFVWLAQDPTMKKKIIGFHYSEEGGVTLKPLFT